MPKIILKLCDFASEEDFDKMLQQLGASREQISGTDEVMLDVSAFLLRFDPGTAKRFAKYASRLEKK